MTKAGDEDEQDRKRTAHIDVPLGARLRALREDRGLTQAELGQKLDISGNQWGRHESGENRMPAGRLWQFCNVLNIDVATVYEGLPFNLAPRGAQPGVEDIGAVFSGPPQAMAGQPLVQRIGAAARDLPPARQRTVLAVIRALKDEDDG